MAAGRVALALVAVALLLAAWAMLPTDDANPCDRWVARAAKIFADAGKYYGSGQRSAVRGPRLRLRGGPMTMFQVELIYGGTDRVLCHVLPGGRRRHCPRRGGHRLRRARRCPDRHAGRPSRTRPPDPSRRLQRPSRSSRATTATTSRAGKEPPPAHVSAHPRAAPATRVERPPPKPNYTWLILLPLLGSTSP
jgi:hypothetical protein